MTSSKFAIALNCIDGRIQSPIQQWLKEKYDVDYVDVVTEHGIEKLFSDSTLEEEIKNKVSHLSKINEPKVVLISGHHDCEGNPVSKEEQFLQIKNAKMKIKSWGFLKNVVGAWIDKDWKVKIVD